MLKIMQSLFRQNVVPDFLILGAQKAGTTTLYDLLAGLPNFLPSTNKELGFFCKEVLYNKGMNWYERQFPKGLGFRFEATPAYIYHPLAPERIYKHNPKCNFIVLLREPASRCYSAYTMYRRFNTDRKMAEVIYNNFTQYSDRETRMAMSELLFCPDFPSFRLLVSDDMRRISENSRALEPSLVRRGLYAMQIKNYLRYFKINQFLFLEQSELDNPIKLFEKIENFLNVKIEGSDCKNALRSNSGNNNSMTDDEFDVLESLRLFYKPHNDELFDLINIQYNWI